MHTLAAVQTQVQPHPLPQPRLRPVDPADREAMRRFVQGLSAASRGLRFHGGVRADSDRLLTHLTQVDGRRHIAFVAVLACDDGELIVGEAGCVRGTAARPEEPAEFAIAVADAWQGRGLARQLLRALLATAAEAEIDTVVGDVLAHNGRMVAFMQREGFVMAAAEEAGVQRWSRTLAPHRPSSPALPAGWLARLRQRLGLRRGALYGLSAT
jgi:acetyltransferase